MKNEKSEQNQLLNEDLEQLIVGIKRCGNQNKQPFRTIMVHNLKVITKEIEGLYEGLVDPDGWKAYQEQLDDLLDIYTVDRPNGKPVFGENEMEFNREFTDLKKRNRELIAKKRMGTKDFIENVMKLPISDKLDIRFIDERQLPKELTIDQISGIDALIIYEDSKDSKDKV